MRIISILLFFTMWLLSYDIGMHYFVNRVQYPLDIENIDISKLKNYSFIRLHISKKGEVSGYEEYYPYLAPYTRLSLIGTYDFSSGLIKVVANGWLHKEFYYKKGRLYVQKNDLKEAIDEVDAKEFIKRYTLALTKLQNDYSAQKMRKLQLGYSIELDPSWGEMNIYPIGFKKVSHIDPKASPLWFIHRLLEAGGWKKGEATPKKIMAKFKGFVASDFNNTGRLEHIIDGLILLDNYLVRTDLSPFSCEHMETIESNLLGIKIIDQ